MLCSSRPFFVTAFATAIVLLAMQVYALNKSTSHIFMDMPPMCELCDIAKNSDNGVQALHQPVTLGTRHLIENQVAHSQIRQGLLPRYQSRAPPFFHIHA
ncbi:MAG: hypothetical protein OEZ58_15490 [Gammaproteobacteria bacterium]|nr:hypothetical protein [Gammaproteobacteria bacterium]MDH5730399.1 hypothetical protein [Gammaproteobacteria bacterium]